MWFCYAAFQQCIYYVGEVKVIHLKLKYWKISLPGIRGRVPFDKLIYGR